MCLVNVNIMQGKRTTESQISKEPDMQDGFEVHLLAQSLR